MALLKLNLAPSPKDLRVFAGCLTVFLLIFAAMAWRKDAQGAAQILALSATAVLLIGLILPRALTWVFKGAVLITYPIGFILSHVIMAVIFFVVMMPIGLIMRGLGRDPLNRKFSSEKSTYWEKKSESAPPSRYLRQF